MTDQTTITVTLTGSGQSFEVTVTPGDYPEDVLDRLVENESEYTLRRTSGMAIGAGTDLYEITEEGTQLYAAVESAVESTPGDSPTNYE